VRGKRIDPDRDVYDPERLFDMEIRFAPYEGKPRPEKLEQISLAPYVPMTPADLRNLPWARLLRAAEAIVIAQHSDSVDAWNAATAETSIAEPIRKPGRPRLGHAQLFGIAERYRQLVEAGDPAPAQRIAEERNEKPSTVRGWIKRARDLGFLPPARPGRAG
jgi:hypothetical protein